MTAYFKTTGKLLAAGWKSLLLPVALIALLSVLAGLFGSFALSQGAVLEPVNIALVNLDESREANLALNAFLSQDGELVKIILTSADKAAALLANGEVTAVFSIPPQFAANVISGRNMSVWASYNSATPLRSTLVAAFADSFTEMLKTSQAGVYAALDLAAPLGEKAVAAVIQKVNLRFLTLVMGRGNFFAAQTVSATGQASPAVHYFVSAWLCLITLLAVMLQSIPARCLAREHVTLLRISRRGAIGPVCGVILSYWLWHSCANALIAAGYMWISKIPFSQSTLLALLPAILAVSFLQAAFTVMCACAFHGQMSGSVFLCCYAVLSLILSGGLVPTAFLGDALRRLGTALPTTQMLRLLGSAFSLQTDFGACVRTVGFGVAFAVLSFLFVQRSGKAVKEL